MHILVETGSEGQIVAVDEVSLEGDELALGQYLKEYRGGAVLMMDDGKAIFTFLRPPTTPGATRSWAGRLHQLTDQFWQNTYVRGVAAAWDLARSQFKK